MLIFIPWWVIFSLPAFRNLHFVPGRMDLVSPLQNRYLVYYQGNNSHRLLKSLFKCVSVLVTCLYESKGKGHQHTVLDPMTQLVSYHCRILKKAKGYELTLKALQSKLL